jgi:diguanylate cyclase (GGDEF)-like protein/PAS domain S-box-containing protein
MASEALQMQTIVRTGRFGPYEKEYICKDGSLIPLSLSGVLLTGKDGQQYIWCIVEDISERKQAETKLRESEKSLNEAQALAQIGSYITDLKTGIWQASPALEKIFGIDASFVTNIENWGKLMAPGYEQKMLDYYQSVVQGDGTFNMDYEIVRPCDGQTRWVAALGRFVYDADGTPAFLKGTIQDITERKLAEQQIRKLAFFDSLTALPNRLLLMDRLQHALASSVRRQQHGALILIDLDHFKNLNDTLGHKQGDLLLEQVARRLEASVRSSDTVARLGGDEFVVLLEDLGEDALQAANQAAVVAEKVRLQLSRYFELGYWAHNCTISIGVTLFGDHAEDVDSVLIRADLAMYKAKDAGRNTLRFFDPQMQSEIAARVVLDEDLREAVREKQFCVHYQAQVDGGNRIVGVEALLRWFHPKRGWVSPGEFIAQAENSGLILSLGQWVLETACSQLALWAKQVGMDHLTLAVNVSAHQFHDRDFVAQVLETLERTGANPGLLKLELTESLLLNDVENMIDTMHALKASGVHFALDDFGTGYSSLSYLKRLPLDQLKIDQSFVRDIMTDPDDAVIARMVIALAQSMGLAVLAEGVESLAQRDLLAEMGCHNYQGYLFGAALPLAEFESACRKNAMKLGRD